jgi:hypothetical protein
MTPPDVSLTTPAKRPCVVCAVTVRPKGIKRIKQIKNLRFLIPSFLKAAEQKM